VPGEIEALLDAEHEPPGSPRPPSRGKNQNRAKRNQQKFPGLPKKPGDEPKPGEPGVPAPRLSRATKPKSKLPKRPFASTTKNPRATPTIGSTRYNQQRVWNAYLAHGDFAETGWNWKIAGKTVNGGDLAITLSEKKGDIVMPDGQSGAEFGRH